MGSSRQAADPAEFASNIHAYVREFIELADQKAGFVFAAATAFLTYEVTHYLEGVWPKEGADWTFLPVLSIASMISLVLAAISSAIVVLPRRSRSHEGIVFFGSIAAFRSAKAYAAAVLATTGPDLTRALLQHAFDLARICNRKYAVLTWALWFLVFGALSGATVLLLMPRAPAS